MKYLQQRPSGLWYYNRRIPQELRAHFGGRLHKLKSLQTRDKGEAIRRAAQEARLDDALWRSLRSPKAESLGLTTRETMDAAKALLATLGIAPGDTLKAYADGEPDPMDRLTEALETKYGDEYLSLREDGDDVRVARLLSPVEREAHRILREDPDSPRVLLSAVVERYLADNAKGRQRAFVSHTKGTIAQLEAITGDWPLEQYKRTHANAFRDHLTAKGNSTGTVRRRLAVLKAVFNVGRREFDLQSLPNPFERVPIAGEGQDEQRRSSFTQEELRALAAACQARDDDIRHIIAIAMDTGARLGEVVGLRLEDVNLTHETPHLYIRPHASLGRTLKTAASERKVPLVGLALWAASRAVESATSKKLSGGWLFPRYATKTRIKATHASNTINKWIRATLHVNKTTHCLRHTMKDRLRHYNVPEEIQHAIGGWGRQTVPQGYGEGHALGQLKENLERIVLKAG